MQRITMEDVAREAGVSRALVSLAYRNGYGVSAEARDRILEIGSSLGYTPNRVAARLAGRGGDTLGVFLQDLHNDLFADIYDGLREVADNDRKHLVLAVGSIDGERDTESLETLQARRVDILIAAGLQLPDDVVVRVSKRVPLVTVARGVPGVDGVATDNRLGARLATEHLLQLGHRRVAFLANPPTDGYLDRAAGYADTMRAAGLTPQSLVTSYARGEVAADTTALLDGDDPPTGIFAHNDQAALGALDAISARGLIAGRDISVVGFDNSAGSRLPQWGLTTVDIHSRRLGRRAATLALRRMAEPDAISTIETVAPTLVVRETTGPLAL